MDWNWFFSSLSQSAAAIVGIFGAFIITKILSNQTQFNEKTRKCQEVTLACKKVAERANDLSITWYNKRKAEEELENLEEILKENDSMSPEHYYDQLRFPIYLPRDDALEMISSHLSERKARLEREEKERMERAAKFSKTNPGFAFLEPMPLHTPSLPTNLHIRAQLEKERDAMMLFIPMQGTMPDWLKTF